MGVTNLLKTTIPFNLTHISQFNFPLQNPTIAINKFAEILVPKSNHNFQNIITSSKITSLRSCSFSQNHKPEIALAASETQTQTLLVSPKMETTDIARRNIALLMLLSVFVAASPASSASSSEEADFINKTISSNKIVIFSKSYCPYCRRAKEVFKELNQAPHVIELDERDDGWSIQDALSGIVGRRTVPQVFINGKHIGGSDDTVEAYQNGELAKLLGIESTDRDDL